MDHFKLNMHTTCFYVTQRCVNSDLWQSSFLYWWHEYQIQTSNAECCWQNYSQQPYFTTSTTRSLYTVYKANRSYLLIVNFQIRHADAVVPPFVLILSFDQFEDLTHGSGDHARLLWTAQHGVSLTYERGRGELARKKMSHGTLQISWKTGSISITQRQKTLKST